MFLSSPANLHPPAPVSWSPRSLHQGNPANPAGMSRKSANSAGISESISGGGCLGVEQPQAQAKGNLAGRRINISFFASSFDSLVLIVVKSYLILFCTICPYSRLNSTSLTL